MASAFHQCKIKERLHCIKKPLKWHNPFWQGETHAKRLPLICSDLSNPDYTAAHK
jgi:hypothetical protein